jgi:hypothetical protein
MYCLHPVDLGDLPPLIRFSACEGLFPCSNASIRSHHSHSEWLVRQDGTLMVDIRLADAWLDARGAVLLSTRLLERKRRRNPGWTPAGDRLHDALAGRREILEELGQLIARQLHQIATGEGGHAARS